MNIQWYPGHMVKTKKMIRENLKLVDLVLEITDARAPISTHLPDIDSLTGNKKVIMVLNKADLADKEVTKLWINHFKKQGIESVAVDTLRKTQFKKLFDIINTYGKMNKSRSIRCMVIGVPNVGKSSLINQLAKRKSAKTGDIPGVTRSKMWLKVNEGLDLLDTPGILWPKFEDKATGVKLALLGCIKQELLNIEQLSTILIEFLVHNYPQSLELRYKVDTTQDPIEIFKQIAKNRGFLASGGILDLERCARTLIDEFRQGKLGEVSLEAPEEKGGFWAKISNQDTV